MSIPETTRQLKLVPHDDGVAVVLDPAILQQLDIDSSTPLILTVAGRSLVITPVACGERREKFEAAKTDTFVKYDQALKRLAE
jgi:antitoxin component of MazEF toxin-antitoxin module